LKRTRRKKILVVDNHPVILKFMTQLLEKNGYEVQTAEDGLAALEVLKDYTPDVAFVDLVMPNISGSKLCRMIRGISKLRDVYLVILSAIVAEQTVDVAEFGADACIAKGPFSQMAKHVLSVIEKRSSATKQVLKKNIMGGGDFHLCEITKELLSVKNHLEVVMMSMLEGIIELSHDSRVVYANPKALTLLKVPEEKLLGSYFLELFQDEARDQVEKLLDTENISLEKNRQTPALQVKGKDITLNVSPVKDEQGKTLIVINDVTQQKRMEAQLRQAEKMEAIGTLAGGIAHDFNNLLMAIQGTVSLILFNIDGTHPLYDKLINIEQWVESGAKLTNQLLGYARKGKYEVKPISLNVVVEEIAETFRRTRKQIVIQRELSDKLYTTKLDKGQIEQVLFNLYVNAANAMPGGGRLILKTRNTSHEQMQAKIYKPKPGRYVELTVGDTGAGMDKKTLGRIFEPFFTTKDMGRGTGLGLASVHGIVKSHDGYIDVESEEGVGTTFKVYFPATIETYDRDDEDRSCGEIPKGTETILLVDDERMIIEVGQELLEAMGYGVLTALDGKEAVETYRSNHKSIDLVILDMIMPEINGGDVYDMVKEINPDIKVLLSSGYSKEGQAQEILARGCDGFIQKPFHINELSQSIKKVLEQ